jgi:hypothetical protein
MYKIELKIGGNKMTDAQNEAKGLRKTAWASYIMNNLN